MRVICKLKNLMDAKEISQLELAEKTGLAPSTIGRLYRNQISRVDIATLTVLGEYFNLNSISEIIEYEM